MRSLTALLSLSILAPAWGQTALLREDDPSPDGAAGQTISSIGVPSVNAQGGFAVSLVATGSPAVRSQLFGSPTGGPGAFIREEMLIGNYDQRIFDLYFGLTSQSVVYAASGDDTASGMSSVDSIWIDGTLYVRGGDAGPFPNSTWQAMERPDVTDGDEIYFRGTVSDTTGNGGPQSGLFIGPSFTPIYLTGEMYPNLPDPLSSTALDFNYQLSPDGTHNIAELDLEATIFDDSAIAIDGSGLVLGGTLVREGNIIPSSIGGIGDEWDNFDFLDINNAGQYAFSGDSLGAIATDEFLVLNGSIFAREGDTLDGEVLTGFIDSLAINEEGTLAFVWSIENSSGGSDEALFVDDEILLREGDLVDWDGDGMLDPGVTIESFTGSNTVVLTDAGLIYFTADVDVFGSTLEGLFTVEVDSIGMSYCSAAANSTGSVSSIQGSGSTLVSMNDMTLQASDLPAFAFSFFIVSDMQGFVAMPGVSLGNLCLSGSIGRYVGPGQIQNTGAAGQITLPIDLTAIPQPLGPVAVQPGETWNFQAWHRDLVNGVAVSNFSRGYAINFQ